VEVLIIEDNEAQSKLMVSLLKAARYVAQTAAAAEEALELLQWFRPQLILVDLQIPGMDGLEFVKRLRLDPAQRKTVIVALTAFTHYSDLQRTREAGCDGHIPKPLDPAMFLPVIREFSRGLRSTGSSDNQNSLVERRSSFLAEGRDQAEAILRDLASGKPCAREVIHRVINRWAEVGGSLAFPEIAAHARAVEELLGRAEFPESSLQRAIEIACHRFEMAAQSQPVLPSPLNAGLTGVRIGLVGLTEEEIDRIQRAAEHSHVPLAFHQIEGDWMSRQTEYDALIVNHLAGPDLAVPPEKLTVPAVLISSRDSLQSLLRLSSRSFDFLIAPCDPAEVLMRLVRLLSNAAPVPLPAALDDTSENRKRQSRVLVADDDPDVIALVTAVFRQSDIECDVALNGSQALAALRERIPDAIVLDVEMPDLDGFEVLKRVRRNFVTRELPVLMLTARGQRTDVARGANDGADAYMVKPFQASELVQRVAQLISASGKRPGARTSGPKIEASG
jgi:DNA-binding response OmpR family regulator